MCIMLVNLPKGYGDDSSTRLNDGRKDGVDVRTIRLFTIGHQHNDASFTGRLQHLLPITFIL